MKPEDITEDHIRKGADALVPFVKVGWLQLNPEHLEELAAAVLLHFDKPGNDARVYDEIDKAVNELSMKSSICLAIISIIKLKHKGD